MIVLNGIVVQAMSINQTQSDILQLEHAQSVSARLRARLRISFRTFARAAAILLILVLAGGSAVPAQQARVRQYAMTVSAWGFDLLDWEAHALAEKAGATLTRPAQGLDSSIAADRVVQYLERANRIGQIEHDIERVLSEGGAGRASPIDSLQRELDALRVEQDASSPQVEQIVQRQTDGVLSERGIGVFGHSFPPVQFTFTEPPKKLIVSPRDRIATEYSKMLDPDIPLADVEWAEREIDAGNNVRAYITNIGGLGAFPTMVVDRASLEWVLSTVAHEWTHNYLALYPLGWNYFKSQDMTTLNETVAEIIGDEIGILVAERYYPSVVAPPGPDVERDILECEPPEFDFREEMRETRLEVDRLLAAGQVDEAEEYMERRRKTFVENGYPLRVLNQAYFAFHGSYGTSAASTSPIGPKLRDLREMTPSLEVFLNTVKWFIDIEDLDKALDEWTSRSGG